MKSRNVHSEIVFALSPNNNIAESFRKFGISDQTRNLLVIKVLTGDGIEASTKQLEWAVEAKPVEFNDSSLARLSNLADIKKIYKLNAQTKGSGKGSGKDDQAGSGQSEAEERKEMEMAILGQMALRGAS